MTVELSLAIPLTLAVSPRERYPMNGGSTGDSPVPPGNLPDGTSLKGWHGPAQGKRSAALGCRTVMLRRSEGAGESPALFQSAFGCGRETQGGARPARLPWASSPSALQAILDSVNSQSSLRS